jgi:hypothetical protein
MEAKFRSVPLRHPRQTAAEMARLCTVYAKDLGHLANLSLPAFFNVVRKLPYRPDPKTAETLSRPKYLLEKDYAFRDCDDKAILMGAYCYLKGYPFGFYASSIKPSKQLHHVWTIAKVDGKNVVLDPTYSHHKFGELPKSNQITKIEKLIEVGPMNLHTYEGLGELGFLKKIKRIASRPVASSVRATKKMGTAVKSGSIKKIGKASKNLVLAPVRDTTRASTFVVRKVAGAMPSGVKNAIKKAVRKVAGDNVSLATKAIILPAATAAALAVPGAQPFAPAVPVVVNLALDEIIKEVKAKTGKEVKKVIARVNAQKKPTENKSVLASQAAKNRAAELKARLQAAKQRQSIITQKTDAAKERAGALKNRLIEAKEAKETEKKISPIALIGGGVGVVLVGYLATRKKRG